LRCWRKVVSNALLLRVYLTCIKKSRGNFRNGIEPTQELCGKHPRVNLLTLLKPAILTMSYCELLGFMIKKGILDFTSQKKENLLSKLKLLAKPFHNLLLIY